MAEWPRCLVDLMPGSVGAESVAIIASVGCCVVEGEGRREGKSPRRIDGQPTNVDPPGLDGISDIWVGITQYAQYAQYENKYGLDSLERSQSVQVLPQPATRSSSHLVSL